MLSTLNLCVMGKFIGQWPRIMALTTWAKEKWALQGEVNFSILPKGFVAIYFSLEEDLNFVLEEGPWFLGNFGLYIQKWYEGFHPKIEVISKVPIWVQMYGLP